MYSQDILVKFKDSTPRVRIDSTIRNLNLLEVKGAPLLGVTGLKVPAVLRKDTIVEKLLKDKDVIFAQENNPIPPAIEPNDPGYLNQKSYLDILQTAQAWEIHRGGREVIAAVLDTGVSSSHPDLQGLLVPGWNAIDGSTNTEDIFGHGTPVAGTISALTNNGVGIAALNWGTVKIMPVRITNDSSQGLAYPNNTAQALEWARQNGAKVANLSYAMADQPIIQWAASQFIADGGVLCISAGNNGATISYFNDPNIITVGSVAGSVITSWSNRGPAVDVMAPGTTYSTSRTGGYGNFSGTSFSSPLTASLAAYLLSIHESITPRQVIDTILNSADDLGAVGYDPIYSWGRINVFSALNLINAGGYIDTTPPVVSITAPSNANPLVGTVLVEVTATDNVAVASVEFYANNVLLGTDTTVPYSINWNTNPYPGEVVVFTAIAKDPSNNSAEDSIAYTIQDTDTIPPTVEITSPLNRSFVTGRVQVTANAYDNKGISKVELFLNGKLQTTSTVAPYTTMFNANKLKRNGIAVLELKATDTSNNVGWSQEVTVLKR